MHPCANGCRYREYAPLPPLLFIDPSFPVPAKRGRQHCYHSHKKEPAPVKVYTVAEEPAEFPGGASALFHSLRKQMQVGTISPQCGGCITIRLSFTVEKDGSTSHISVQDRHCCFSNIEASLMQGFSAMPKWKPARMHGEVVRCYYTLPIRIRVN